MSAYIGAEVNAIDRINERVSSSMPGAALGFVGSASDARNENNASSTTTTIGWKHMYRIAFYESWKSYLSAI